MLINFLINGLLFLTKSNNSVLSSKCIDTLEGSEYVFDPVTLPTLMDPTCLTQSGCEILQEFTAIFLDVTPFSDTENQSFCSDETHE